MVTRGVKVRSEDRCIGAVSFDTESGFGPFKYIPDFSTSCFELLLNEITPLQRL
jgi:hypothetical protein